MISTIAISLLMQDPIEPRMIARGSGVCYGVINDSQTIFKIDEKRNEAVAVASTIRSKRIIHALGVLSESKLLVGTDKELLILRRKGNHRELVPLLGMPIASISQDGRLIATEAVLGRVHIYGCEPSGVLRKVSSLKCGGMGLVSAGTGGAGLLIIGTNAEKTIPKPMWKVFAIGSRMSEIRIPRVIPEDLINGAWSVSKESICFLAYNGKGSTLFVLSTRSGQIQKISLAQEAYRVSVCELKNGLTVLVTCSPRGYFTKVVLKDGVKQDVQSYQLPISSLYVSEFVPGVWPMPGAQGWITAEGESVVMGRFGSMSWKKQDGSDAKCIDWGSWKWK